MSTLSEIYYDREYNWIDNKDVVFNTMQRNLYGLVGNMLDLKRDDNLLDVGCGQGIFVPFSKQSNYYGIDISKGNIQTCKKKFPKKKFKRLEFNVMDSCNIDYRDNSFDKVVCTEVLEHITIDEIHRTLQEISRVTVHGGKIVITTPNLYYLWGIIPWSFKPLRRRVKIGGLIKGIKNGWVHEEYHVPHKRFKPSFFKKLLQEYFIVEGYTTSFWYNNRAIHGLYPEFQKAIHEWSWKGNSKFGNNIIAVLKNNKGECV